MRLALLVILVPVALLQPACESCEFSFGSLESAGHLIVKGAVPADLVIETCTSPAADDCLTGTINDNGDLGLTYSAYTPSEGTVTCSFEHHWLVATGTDCLPTAIDITDPAIVDRTALDVTLHCTVSGS